MLFPVLGCTVYREDGEKRPSLLRSTVEEVLAGRSKKKAAMFMMQVTRMSAVTNG